jgi:CMP-N-acetylneuraminic acid synthetase
MQTTRPEAAIDDTLKPIALIPARGGSKGIPGKNLRPVAGVPLVVRSVQAALNASCLDGVWVSSDDPQIGQLAAQAGGGWLRRPEELAGDQASSETALLDALGQLAERGPLPPLFVFLQCTSPFTTGSQIDAVVNALQDGEANMAFSVVPWHGFLWQQDHHGHGVGINHDAHQPRQRRQDLPPTYLETGAIYAIRTARFLQAGSRFVQPTLPVPLDGMAPEIDTPEDLNLCERLAPLLEGARQPPANQAAADQR